MSNAGPALDADTIVDFIADIFHRRGADSYLGEDVTMSEHMLQTAMLAERAGADHELVAAALLHDIGHYTNEFPEDALERGLDNRHDRAGAAVLAPWFPPRTVTAVRWHVQAKRYLCAVEADYYGRLSDASIHTLSLQGGVMGDAEAKAFSRQADLDAILAVRRFDDDGKVAGVATPDFAHYAPMLRALTNAGR